MTKQVINVGTSANSKNGDPLRTAFIKINENFTEVYNSSTDTISLTQLKLIISESTDFNDFKLRIENL